MIKDWPRLVFIKLFLKSLNILHKLCLFVCLSTYEADFKTGGAPGWLLFRTLLPFSFLSQKLQYLEAKIGYFVTGKKKNDGLIWVRYSFKLHFDFQVHLLLKLSSFFLSLPPCRSPLISDHFLNKGAEFVSLFWQIHCRLPSFFISINTLPLGQNYALYIPSCKMSAVKSSCHCFLQWFSKRNFVIFIVCFTVEQPT